jgi:hypothetical protein
MKRNFKNEVIDLFIYGYTKINAKDWDAWREYIDARKIHACGGAYLFHEGAQIFYNDSPAEVRRLIGEMLLIGSVIVPRSLCWAFEQNILACHGAALANGCVYYINY